VVGQQKHYWFREKRLNIHQANYLSAALRLNASIRPRKLGGNEGWLCLINSDVGAAALHKK
jgi:hypothetical protein